ncbi:hypothetical protein SDJN03_14019, partial [Cucurbita argyrosperma subsp. sororia]
MVRWEKFQLQRIAIINALVFSFCRPAYDSVRLSFQCSVDICGQVLSLFRGTCDLIRTGNIRTVEYELQPPNDKAL